MAIRPQQEPILIILAEIGLCWVLAIGIGTVPLYFYDESATTCYLEDILRHSYLIARFVVVVVIPLIIMGFVYFRIYKFIRERVRM